MIKILDVKIDTLNLTEVLELCGQFLKIQKCHQIVTVNPEFIVEAQGNRQFKKILNQADLNIPDGFGLQLAARALEIKIGERLTGVDLTWELVKHCARSRKRLFLLGGAEGVAQKTGQIFKTKYSKLKIAGTYAGSPEEKGIVKKINSSKPDILLVAFGAPKQDKFIFQNKNKLKCQIAVGVGGTFDYIAGIIPRAPKWLRNLGLEWLYRLIKEPRRLKRIVRAVIIFPLLILFKG